MGSSRSTTGRWLDRRLELVVDQVDRVQLAGDVALDHVPGDLLRRGELDLAEDVDPCPVNRDVPAPEVVHAASCRRHAGRTPAHLGLFRLDEIVGGLADDLALNAPHSPLSPVTTSSSTFSVPVTCSSGCGFGVGPGRQGPQHIPHLVGVRPGGDDPVLARRSLAALTIFIALVSCIVFETERMRRLMSLVFDID